MSSDPQPWLIESSRYVYECRPYMCLREDSVLLPTGARIPNYFVFEYPDWVSVLAVTRDERFVLIRQYRHGLRQVHYELPAGVADEGVSLLENAQRELLEETGFGGGQWQFYFRACANPGTHTNWCHLFLATDVEPLQPPDSEPTEDLRVCLLTRNELLHALRHEGMAQAIHAAALWRWLAEKGCPQEDNPPANLA
ncbi:MAG: NUDIX hydrolase [Saprospiraceae bacterium]|nr:NUDIX hydrolase [Saprospiraceae bacterium]